jgi:hypothetical protein
VSREKARQALKTIDALKQKVRDQQREVENLEASLLHEGYFEKSHLFTTPDHIGYRPPKGACHRCGGRFHHGEYFIEYLDDDDRVVATYHQQCAGTR